jgi:hypothetical protein
LLLFEALVVFRYAACTGAQASFVSCAAPAPACVPADATATQPTTATNPKTPRAQYFVKQSRSAKVYGVRRLGAAFTTSAPFTSPIIVTSPTQPEYRSNPKRLATLPLSTCYEPATLPATPEIPREEKMRLVATL